MKKINKKPLEPTVTVEEFLAFDADNPETWTSSTIVNAVADAFHTVRPLSCKNIAAYLDVDQTKLTHALEIITGHTLISLRYHWLQHRLAAIGAAHPDWGSDQVAHALGFFDRSSLRRFLAKQNN